MSQIRPSVNNITNYLQQNISEDHDDDIGNTSDWVSQKSKQQKSCCCSRWKLVIIFLVILTSLCLGSIGFGVYLMLRFQDFSVELERAGMFI